MSYDNERNRNVSYDNEERYRYRGVTRAGGDAMGVFTIPPADLVEWVQGRYQAGWRELTVCAGPGPVPPRYGEDWQSGGIGPDPETGRRTWWAES